MQADWAGVDEVGRGTLAGSVVAAAVIMPDGLIIPPDIKIIDSKKLTPAGRQRAAAFIMAHSVWAIASASVAEIDTINILQATMLAMQRAVMALPQTPAGVLVDGNRAPALPLPTRAIIGGDASAPAIAAASIIAKVWRDNLMNELAAHYPHYAWQKNKGYGSPAHLQALKLWGVSPYHRRSFAPVAQLVKAA